jgi:hypothetical protein
MSFQENPVADGKAAASANAGALMSPPASSGRPRRPPPPPPLAAQTGGFGGRKQRYVVQKHQQLRCFDPITNEYVTFGHEREYRAWLVPRFDPQVLALTTTPAAIAYKRLGQKFSTTPLLAWQTPKGRKVGLWLKQSWPPELRRAYEHFSFTHGIQVELKTWDQLDQTEVLIDNLELARQLMATAANAAQDLGCVCDAIEAHLQRCGGCTRGELGALLSCEGCVGCDEHLDAALFQLHARGVLHLELDVAAYDDDTRICAR